MKLLHGFWNNIRWEKTKIRRQMYGIYGMVLFVPLITVGLILLISARQMLSEHYTNLLEADNSRVKSLLSEVTTHVYTIMEDVYFESSIKSILSVEYEDTSEFVGQVNSFGTLDSLLYNGEFLEGLYIYTDNPTIKDYKQYRYATEDIEASDWYQNALETTNAFWTSIKEKSYTADESNLCLVRRISLTDSPYHAVLVIKISDSYLRGRLGTGSTMEAISIGEDGIVYSSKKSWYGQAQPIAIDFSQNYFKYSGTVDVEGGEYFATVSTISLYRTNTKMYICTMDGKGITAINRIMSTWSLLLVLVVLVPGMILIAFSEYFARRVHLLRAEMHKARLQDYNIVSEFPGNDELKEAFDDLKFMVQDIKGKEAKMYEVQLNEKELRNKQQMIEYKMLAHQINPHYLYNTLETIRMKALTEGNRDVANAIKVLGKTLHYVLENNGTTMTTMDKELDHVKNYLAIQKMRFGERINDSIIIEPKLELQKCHVLPLLLQPVVENAVVHGLESVNGFGLIKIEISSLDDLLTISISDNGKGIGQEELERIETMLDTPDLHLQSGIALYNIHQRIRLCYGAEYGIKLESTLEMGTKVVLTFPAQSDIEKK